jgi:hypothetical protein
MPEEPARQHSANVVGNIALKNFTERRRGMKIKICDLRAPAKCTRTQIHYNVPFAESELCDECEHQVTATIVSEEKTAVSKQD